MKNQNIVNKKSIAILPFVNMSSDPENEYFSDGITEEIINALTRIEGLKVIARTSSFAFKGKAIDIREIGKQLGVNTILEGSVRKAKAKVRITAQLIKTEDGSHIWSRNFDRELVDIFVLQDEISLLIADQIRENFGHLEIQEHLIEASTQNIEAYDIYLKARYNHLKWNAEGITNGIKYYEQCMAMDPNFSLPYFGIGYCYAMRASFHSNSQLNEIADGYISKGFQLDDQSDLGYFASATLRFWGKWDVVNGHRYYKKSISLNPANTEAEEGLVELYTAIGYFDKALQHAQNILSINPLSPNHYFTKGNIHYLTKDYRKALECMESALRIDPNFTHAIVLKQLCYIHLQEYNNLDSFLKSHPLVERPLACRTLYKLVNPGEHADIDLKEVRSAELEDRAGNLFLWHLFLMVHLGNHEIALDILEKHIEKRTGQIINFCHTPLLAPLHTYERFQQLAQSTFQTSLLPHEKKAVSAQPRISKNLIDTDDLSQFLIRLKQEMENQKLYINASLSLRELADHLNIHANKLSWLLNEHLGQNFNEYVNAYRLEAFKAKALDPANAHLTLLALAYESGFNSKTVFNSFFKKSTGMTPRKWLKSHHK